MPRRGAAILVCNHVSGLDPMLIQSLVPRLIVWMMAKEYYDLKALAWFYEAVEAIPVQRSGRDLAATRAALACWQRVGSSASFRRGGLRHPANCSPFKPALP